MAIRQRNRLEPLGMQTIEEQYWDKLEIGDRAIVLMLQEISDQLTKLIELNTSSDILIMGEGEIV